MSEFDDSVFRAQRLSFVFLFLLCLAFSTPLPAAEPVIPDPISADRLMDALYGKPSEPGIRTWRIPNDLPISQWADERGQERGVSPVIARSYQESGTDKFLLLAATVRDTCHACSVLIGAFVYGRVGNSWRPEVTTRALTLAGNFGQPPKAELRQLGPVEFGFELRDSYTSTGETWDTLYIYRVTAGKFVPVLGGAQTRHAYEELSGPEDTVVTCREARYTIRPLPSTAKGLFDLDALIRYGIKRKTPADTVASACDVPIERSPNYRRLRTRLVFTGSFYCQEKALSYVDQVAPLCQGE